MIEKTFEGVPRNKIPWAPKIDYKKCTTCGKCVDFCHNHTFKIEEKEGKKKTFVKGKNACVVLCRGCEDICPVGAITHPSEKKTRKIIDELKRAKADILKAKEVKQTIKKAYSKIASESGSCFSCNSSCCGDQISPEQTSKSIGYTEEEINTVSEANLGLGCGNPTALGKIREGDVVLDLGSGAGFDCFIAAKKVGKSGRVIGIDMTREMIKKAKSLAKKHGYTNVEFRLGDIEKLPVENESVDVVISNCVINLAPDKTKVFNDVHRVLKPNGKMYVSDIVLLKELDDSQKNDKDLLTGCVAGALLKDDYLAKLEKAGFKVKVLSEDKEISERQYNGIALESIKLQATKVN